MANYKTNFEYHVPATVEEALNLLDMYREDGKVIAGGTDLIPKVKAGVMQFNHLISLKEIEELKSIEVNASGEMCIGAYAGLREAETNPVICENYPALSQGIHSMANTQIRNRGTVVGNICNAVPSADTAPALLVYEARVEIKSVSGTREVPISEFFTGVCRTVVQPDELVTRIILPPHSAESFSIYYKYAIRKALDLAMIGVAVDIATDENRVVTKARVALGAVAATPRRAYKTEELLTGKELTEEVIQEAAKTAAEEDCLPISDIRATADYRREMVRIHTVYALRKAVE